MNGKNPARKVKWGTQKPPEKFPDVSSCRVRGSIWGDYFECESPWADECPHRVKFAILKLCHHPSAAKIAKWPKKKGRKHIRRKADKHQT